MFKENLKLFKMLKTDFKIGRFQFFIFEQKIQRFFLWFYQNIEIKNIDLLAKFLVHLKLSY